MVNIKKMISVALMVLIGLTSLSVAFAATSTNSDFTAVEDTNALTIAHGGSVSGTITLTNNIGSGAAMVYDLSATGLPTWMTVTFYEGGTAITQTSSVADAASLTVTYTAAVTANTAPTTTPQAFNIVVGENGASPANTATIAMTATVPSDASRVINQASVVSTVARESSVEITVAIDNSGNENVVMSSTLESLSTGSNTYLALGALTLNWDNEKTLPTTSATVAPETGTNYAITAGNSQNFVITIPTASTDRYGVYTGTLSLMDNSATAVSKDTSALTINLVDANNDVRLKINDGSSDAEFNDKSGDDDKTYPGENIEINDITIDNDVGTDLEDLQLTVTIYNQEDGDEVVDEYEFNKFDLDDNKDEQFDYAFQLPYDITQGTYVIAYYVEGEDSDGNVSSMQAYDTFEVEQDGRHMVIENVDFGEYCAGETAQVTIKIANIGTRDLDKDDDIQVRLDINGFNFDQTLRWDADFDKQESESFVFNVDIPTDTSGSLAEISVFHDGDDDSEDDGATISQTFPLSTDNCTEVVSTDVHGIITGTSVAEGTVGNPTQYTLTIMNTGSTDATYTLEASGITGWGTAQIEPAGSVTVPAGATSTLYVYLTPNDNAAGSNAAVLTLKSGANVIQTKTLTMNIAGASISTYTNALLGSSIADFGVSQQSLITLLSLATILFVTVGTLFTATQPRAPARKKRGTKKERK